MQPEKGPSKEECSLQLESPFSGSMLVLRKNEEYGAETRMRVHDEYSRSRNPEYLDPWGEVSKAYGLELGVAE